MLSIVAMYIVPMISLVSGITSLESVPADAVLHSPISDSSGDSDGASTPITANDSGESLPDWVLAGSVLEGDPHRVVVESGPHQRIRERDLEMDKALLKATNDYIAWYLENENAPLAMRFDLAYIKSHLVNPHYQLNTVREFKVGPMHTSYAMLEFDQAFRRQLDQRWRDVVATSRMLGVGFVGGAVLALLAVAYSYFRLDHATRGFYTGRLQFLAVAAILVLVTAGVLTARWIPWM
jgi:hypothetical protein